MPAIRRYLQRTTTSEVLQIDERSSSHLSLQPVSYVRGRESKNFQVVQWMSKNSDNWQNSHIVSICVDLTRLGKQICKRMYKARTFLSIVDKHLNRYLRSTQLKPQHWATVGNDAFVLTGIGHQMEVSSVWISRQIFEGSCLLLQMESEKALCANPVFLKILLLQEWKAYVGLRNCQCNQEHGAANYKCGCSRSPCKTQLEYAGTGRRKQTVVSSSYLQERKYIHSWLTSISPQTTKMKAAWVGALPVSR